MAKFDHNEKYYLILELCDMNLQEFSKKWTVFPEKMLHLMLQHILQGLSVLHSLKIIHRDITCKNILIKQVGEETIFKLADFGLARNIEQSMTKNIGTEKYRAVEVLRGDQYNETADCFMFGVVALSILVGDVPWTPEFLKNCSEEEFQARVERSLPDTILNSGRALLRRLLEFDPEKRISSRDAENHQYIQLQVQQHSLLFGTPCIKWEYQAENEITSISFAKYKGRSALIGQDDGRLIVLDEQGRRTRSTEVFHQKSITAIGDLRYEPFISAGNTDGEIAIINDNFDITDRRKMMNEKIIAIWGGVSWFYVYSLDGHEKWIGITADGKMEEGKTLPPTKSLDIQGDKVRIHQDRNRGEFKTGGYRTYRPASLEYSTVAVDLPYLAYFVPSPEFTHEKMQERENKLQLAIYYDREHIRDIRIHSPVKQIRLNGDVAIVLFHDGAIKVFSEDELRNKDIESDDLSIRTLNIESENTITTIDYSHPDRLLISDGRKIRQVKFDI